MVSGEKIQELKNLKEKLGQYHVVGILDMHKLPGRQLHEIRNQLRGQTIIRLAKKRVIVRALGETRGGMASLSEKITGEPALLFTRMDPFKLAKILNRAKSPSKAKTGDVAPKDIVVKEGNTTLSPGPVIGELQRAGLPVAVAGDKISIRKDTVIAKAGEVISQDVANVLSKLGIEPMEIGLDLKAVWDKGIIYGKAVLFVPEEEYIEGIKHANEEAFNLSINIGYFTKNNMAMLLSKAYNEARKLANTANIVTPGNIGFLLSRAWAKAKALEERLIK